MLLKERALDLIKLLRQRIIDPGLCARHRRRAVDFTRQCRLTFPVLMLALIQKSLKSLQARLHELLWQLGRDQPVAPLSAGALTHARAKLCASAFVELNQQVLLPLVYGPAHQELVQRWQGHRLLSVDSTVVRLPKSAAVGKHFGWVDCQELNAQDRYPLGRLSLLYDLLNEVALAARLAPWREPEKQLALGHLPQLQADDLLLTDRGFTSYEWSVAVRVAGGHFVSRCPRSGFAAVQTLFKNNRAGVDVRVTLKAPKELRAECRRQGWPLELPVRLVTVRLANGELEVLVTSLLDATRYPREEFGALYWRRWGQETYFARLKGRMDLEHSSGLTIAAVEQDFAATLLLSNIESLVIGPASAELAARTVHREQPSNLIAPSACLRSRAA